MISLDVFLLVVVLGAATTLGLAGVWWIVVGPHRLQAVLRRPPWLRRRLRAVAPFLAVLVAVLLLNKGLQRYIEQFSQRYGFEATPVLYAIEGDLVVTFQAAVPNIAMGYFSAVYTVGYAVLLIAPVGIYLTADHARPLKLLVTAYTVNYAVAVVCYSLFIAYGPRNVERATSGTGAEAPLLDLVPDITVLTALVNSNTNVFPSLHTSLSVTVMLIAASTQLEFRRWYSLASILAVSIVVATMALGIHWLLDVLAGIGLAFFAVEIARRVVDQ